jgi:threonine aldolase
MLSPAEFVATLQECTTRSTPADIYGQGGPTTQLEQFMARAVGKEAAIFLPTGTLANQIAIRILAGARPYVVVQDQSHVFRDEGDIALAMSGKTLINLAPNQATFSAAALQGALGNHAGQIGAVSIETPVRRLLSERFDFAELQRISGIARRSGVGMHLDGARLFIETVYSDIPVSEYAALFDTVYICLYKCFGAGSGALLCGSRMHIEEAARQRNLFGARVFKTWPSAAVALHVAQGFEDRFRRIRIRAERFFERLNEGGVLNVTALARGTNVYTFTVRSGDPEAFRSRVSAGGGVRWSSFGFTATHGVFRVNETWGDLREDALFERMRRAADAVKA